MTVPAQPQPKPRLTGNKKARMPLERWTAGQVRSAL